MTRVFPQASYDPWEEAITRGLINPIREFLKPFETLIFVEERFDTEFNRRRWDISIDCYKGLRCQVTADRDPLLMAPEELYRLCKQWGNEVVEFFALFNLEPEDHIVLGEN